MNSFQRMPDPFGMKGGNMFEYWVSLWPVAPYFGVEWQFAPYFAPFAQFAEAAERQVDSTLSNAGHQIDQAMKKSTAALRASAKAAPAKAAPKAAETKVAEAKAVAPAPAAPKAVEKPAPKAAETPAAKVAAKVVEKPAAKVVPLEQPAAAPKGGKPAGLMGSAPAKTDDLKLIKGIGPKLERELNGLGVYTFGQMAGFGDKDLAWIDDNLTAFKGRCFRDDWVGQAKLQLG